jgi:putative membrane protein
MNASGYPGFDGFLGTRAPFMIDVVSIAMLGVVLVLGWSMYQVKVRRRFQLHKWTQVTLGVVLLTVVILFELDIRLHGWEERAADKIGGHPGAEVWWALYTHLVFAISTVILWPMTIGLAAMNFGEPPAPGAHSRVHIPLARTAAADMVLTAITGWIFYWFAFVRS